MSLDKCEIMLHCRFDVLQEVAAAAANADAGPDAALQMVHRLLSDSLYVLHDLLTDGNTMLVLPLAQVCAFFCHSICKHVVVRQNLAYWQLAAVLMRFHCCRHYDQCHCQVHVCHDQHVARCFNDLIAQRDMVTTPACMVLAEIAALIVITA